MSAARQLSLADLSNAELDQRAASAVTSYGVGTKSYNNSAEKREIDRQREVITERYLAAPRREYEAPLLCSCPQRQQLNAKGELVNVPPELSVHSDIRSEWYAHKKSLCWPWSLMLSQREEPSTERKQAA